MGKRVSFIQDEGGSWGEYALTTPLKSFIIDESVPINSAASGIVNPLTVIGMTDQFSNHPIR
jgi:NADPH:quinone reductase-like Zn-dependent oxidoreductase